MVRPSTVRPSISTHARERFSTSFAEESSPLPLPDPFGPTITTALTTLKTLRSECFDRSGCVLPRFPVRKLTSRNSRCRFDSIDVEF